MQDNSTNAQNPLIQLNLLEIIAQVKSDPNWQKNDKHTLNLFKSEHLKILLIGLHEEAELKPHKAPGMISVQVIKGEMNFFVGEEAHHLEAGQMTVLEENITHSVQALKETFFLLSLCTK
jgi:quercetin dioxygenase-like cupin family protein